MNLMDNEKHFNTLDRYYKYKYGKKIFKISLNGGFSCPNIDGTVSHGGCSFCSGDFAGTTDIPLKEQFEKTKQIMHNKWHEASYIAYFQANTNTYAPLDVLKEKYESILSLDKNIIGLSLATRCDAISDECLDYLSELSKSIKVQIELGLQTSNEETAQKINRGHSLKAFDEMVKKLHQKKLEVVVHIINGLPGETKEDMIETAKHLNSLNVEGVKIHMLYLSKNTPLGQEYLKNPFKILSLEEYVDIVVEQLRCLNDNIIIHRVTGDAQKETLIEPKWGLKKFVVMNEIDKYMRKNNIYQGDLCK